MQSNVKKVAQAFVTWDFLPLEKFYRTFLDVYKTDGI